LDSFVEEVEVRSGSFVRDAQYDIESTVFDSSVEPGKRSLKNVSKGDLFVYGSTLLMTVADVAKSICSWTSNDGGDVANFVSNIGDLEILVATGLTLYQMSSANPYSVLVAWAQRLSLAAAVATVAEHLGGFGQPDHGTGFTRGAGNLEMVKTTLDDADPVPENWSGDAAKKYAALNAEQKAFIDGVIGMIGCDQEMAKAVAAQAGHAELVRTGIAGAKTVLATAAVICSAWAGIAAVPGPEQPARLVTFNRTVNYLTGTVLVIAGSFGITGIVLGAEDAKEAAKWRKKYGEVKDQAAKMLKAPAPASASKPAPAPASNPVPAPASGPVPASVSDPAPAPAAGSAAAPASDPAPAPAAADPIPVPPAPAPAATTFDSLVSAMGMAMQAEPGMAQAATQGMQSVQQFASMASQSGRRAGDAGRPVAADDSGEANGEGGVQAGAAGEVSGAGRAPVDSAAPASEAAPTGIPNERLA